MRVSRGTLNIVQGNCSPMVEKEFKAEISVGNAKVVSSFVVVKYGHCIL